MVTCTCCYDFHFVVSGCAKLASAINDIKGSLIGNQYTIYTYDNFGNLVLETSGKKIDIAGKSGQDNQL